VVEKHFKLLKYKFKKTLKICCFKRTILEIMPETFFLLKSSYIFFLPSSRCLEVIPCLIDKSASINAVNLSQAFISFPSSG
jgi:hypothetical protein